MRLKSGKTLNNSYNPENSRYIPGSRYITDFRTRLVNSQAASVERRLLDLTLTSILPHPLAQKSLVCVKLHKAVQHQPWLNSSNKDKVKYKPNYVPSLLHRHSQNAFHTPWPLNNPLMRQFWKV